jgi:hypothetical protein
VTQADFNDVIRDMTSRSKKDAELLGSRLQEWKLVTPDFQVTAICNRESFITFDGHFEMHENLEYNLAYCKDVDALFQQIGFQHIPENWRLFIDSSVNSLKVALLHNTNVYPTIPIAYATNMTESYVTMEIILQIIKYKQYKWKICADLKVVGLLMGVKRGFPKYQCFMCKWEGRERELHYTNYEWPSRTKYEVGKESIENKPLVDPDSIILPPLHVKLGLVSMVRQYST